MEIQPGESLRDFSFRVERTMPKVKFKTGEAHRSDVKKLKAKQKGKAAEGGEDDDGEDDGDDDEGGWSDEDGVFDEDGKALPHNFRKTARTKQPKKQKPGQKKRKSNARGGSPDPFAHLSAAAAPIRFGEVAAAPPQFKVLPTNKLRDKTGKVDGGGMGLAGDVPKNAGSFARREALGEERMGVVERYRQLMGRGRGML